MSAVQEAITHLIAAGLEPAAAAALIAAAGAELFAKRRSSNAKRQARYREKKAAETVTNRNGVTPELDRNESVTNRNNVTQPSLLLDNKKERDAKPKALRKLTSLPDNFSLTESMRSYWSAKGLDLAKVEFQFEEFCGYHKAKGSKFVDWEQAWQNWTRKAVGFAEERKKANGGFRYNGIEGVL